jgi:hypothetical protein
MGHLAVPRKGWENEHLATYLLSQIAFVAHPMTVADDVGSDFFCTLFEPREQGPTQMLFPLHSFAIQVKSSRRKVNATNKIEYLHGLEIPFFLGVVDRSDSYLSVYSGEYLPFMFSHLGRPAQLRLHMVDHEKVTASNAYAGTGGGPCDLRLPFVLRLAAADDRQTLTANGGKLAKLCSRMHRNISSWKLDEYIFTCDAPAPERIFAGCGSVQHFRHNFYLRLAEVFFNMEWLYEKHQGFSVAEFEMYDRIYRDLLTNGSEIPPILEMVYERLRGLIDKTYRHTTE